MGLTQPAPVVNFYRLLMIGRSKALIGRPYTDHLLMILYADNRAKDVWLKIIRQPLAAPFGYNMQATLDDIIPLCRVSFIDPLLQIDEGCSHIHALKVEKSWRQYYVCNCCWMQLHLCPGDILPLMGSIPTVVDHMVELIFVPFLLNYSP